MIALKTGVKVGSAQPVVAIIIAIVGSVYSKLGYDCWVTSIDDGKHKPGSFHGKGAAVDFRLNDLSGIPPEKRASLARLARAALGAEFDVLHESPGTANEHLHVEHDPK